MGPNFREIFPLLARNQVRFILIGGGAAIAHGSAKITYDIDVVYARDSENIRFPSECPSSLSALPSRSASRPTLLFR